MKDKSSLLEYNQARKQSQLVNDVLNLNKKPQLEKPSRTEPALQISEFNLVKSITGKQGVVNVNELTKVLKKRAKHVEIGKKVSNAKSKAKTLPKPLEKPKADRIRRAVAFEGVKKQLNCWDAVVTSNRASSQLTFPLPDVKLETDKSFAEFRLKSDLQKELEELEPKVEIFNLENEPKYPLTMQEMMERRKEMAKVRAVQSYKEAKARRQSKIKSKKYHRIQRREKIKQQMKEFEQLQKTNPEEALKKLDEIEKVRATERANLRHRSTGKWARSKQVQAKYDKESRKVLAQQLALSRELTQKVKTNGSESESEGESKPNPSGLSKDNPWTNSNDIEDFVKGYRKFWENKNKEVEENLNEENAVKNVSLESLDDQHENSGDDFEKLNVSKEEDITKDALELQTDKQNVHKKEKVRRERNKKSKIVKRKVKVGTTNWEVDCVSESSDDTAVQDKDVIDNFKRGLKRKFDLLRKELEQEMKTKIKKTKKKKLHSKANNMFSLEIPITPKRPVINEQLLETSGRNDITQNNKNSLDTLEKILNSEPAAKTDVPGSATNIDPNNIVKVKPVNLNTQVPDLLALDLEDDAESNTQNADMLEAFKDDDLVAEFRKDKKAEINKDKPQDINLTLPGWGSWGGIGIKPSKRKQRRFVIKFPKKCKRRDDNKGNLIINEKADANIKTHLVSEVPFPFKTTKDFEASIRAPIGNTFVPETAFRKMIQPPVVTKMGTIIQPMTDDVLLKKKK